MVSQNWVRSSLFSWRLIFYPFLVSLSIATVVMSFNSAAISAQVVSSNDVVWRRSIQDVAEIRRLQGDYVEVTNKFALIDPTLPGVDTSEIKAMQAEFVRLLISRQYYNAKELSREIGRDVDELLSIYEPLAAAELGRLGSEIEAKRTELDLFFANLSLIPANYSEVLDNESLSQRFRMEYARHLITTSTTDILRRQAIMATAAKKIVIRKSELKLIMYENDDLLYEMPVSLGRPGKETRTGEFSIIDKKGTVWGYWQIWLPEWLGIYYAGTSENGIHGLPYDNSGNVYWKASVGKENITYGCVMPNDADMHKLYNWAEVGVPVLIID